MWPLTFILLSRPRYPRSLHYTAGGAELGAVCIKASSDCETARRPDDAKQYEKVAAAV